jgi:hypothetical protein
MWTSVNGRAKTMEQLGNGTPQSKDQKPKTINYMDIPKTIHSHF